jgi:hypothetical protein
VSDCGPARMVAGGRGESRSGVLFGDPVAVGAAGDVLHPGLVL